jgi:hypothetical protein
MRSADRSAGSFAALVLVAALLSLCPRPLLAASSPAPTPSWIGTARIAGLELYADMPDSEINNGLAALAAQGVSVVEADSDLSNYLTDEEFEQEIALMRRFNAAAHRVGLKVVWYYPPLEVLSPNGLTSPRSMFKEHPDEVQIGLNGKPNVFYGNQERVHWVEPTTESAWMSLYSSYVETLIARIRRVAATGVDGLWIDVPLFNDIGAAWADLSPKAAAKFRADTGMPAPTKVDWTDPVWRRWIAWRYDEIAGFVHRLATAARSVSPDVAIIVENVTIDNNSATMLGLDGSMFKTSPEIMQVWEADVLSDTRGMHDALPDDWISMIGMAKFAKAASGAKPSWMFTYGQQPEDGLLVMAEAIAAGNHPYETKTPKMATTIDASYRRHVFTWIKDQERRLFSSQSAAKVAIYYSPESRDYVDKGEGTGIYATTKPDDRYWWSNLPSDSVHQRTYLAEYRGMIKWLVRNHVPFDIVVRPDSDELGRYDVVLAPALTAISDRDAALLDAYVAGGGHLVITGPAPASLDALGATRSTPALASLGRNRPWQVTGLNVPGKSNGTAVHASELLGKGYLTSTSSEAGTVIGALLRPYSPLQIEIDQSTSIHAELRSAGNELLLHLIDPERLWNKSAPKSRELEVGLDIPAGLSVTGVQVTSPAGVPAVTGPLSYDVVGGRLLLKVPLAAYAMVVIATHPVHAAR